MVKSEYEVENGYIDIALLRREPIEPDYFAIFEIKYIKKSEYKVHEQKIVEEKKSNITPVVLDCITPSPGYYLGRPLEAEQGIIPFFASAKDRFKQELVLALALVHHLVFFQYIGFEELIRQLKSFTTKYLVVEFIGPDDGYVSKWMNESFNWYNEDNFKKHLEEYFKIIKITKSFPENRKLFFCELK